jgi:hypothetical protein
VLLSCLPLLCSAAAVRPPVTSWCASSTAAACSTACSRHAALQTASVSAEWIGSRAAGLLFTVSRRVKVLDSSRTTCVL